MLKRIAFMALAASLIIACGESKTDEEIQNEYFQAAYDLFNKESYQGAIENFTKILEDYADGEFAPKSMFMVGYIHANHTRNLEEAKKYYTMFIEKYPDHELVSSAKYELETLGKDVNELEIFKKIEEQEVAE